MIVSLESARGRRGGAGQVRRWKPGRGDHGAASGGAAVRGGGDVGAGERVASGNLRADGEEPSVEGVGGDGSGRPDGGGGDRATAGVAGAGLALCQAGRGRSGGWCGTGGR